MSSNSFDQWLFDLRNDLHQYPELAWQEVRTTQKIKEILSSLGLEPFTLPNMKTGVVANLIGKQERPVLALRADIDALPIEEKTNNPFKSKNPGKMHACGHDANTTIMLGVAKKLVETGVAQNLPGSVKFIFQPAEESLTGAEAMIKNGILEDPKVDAIIAVHMWSDLEEGKFGFYPDYSHASVDNFDLVINGKGAHGAYPDKAIDPIIAGSNFVHSIQTLISRDANPSETLVVSVCQFKSGVTHNVIPESAELKGTIRCFDEDTRKRCAERMVQIVKGLETTFKVKNDFRIFHGPPPCYNHKKITNIIFKAASDLIGNDNIVELKRQTGGEDFAWYTKIIPGSLWRIGCGNKKRGLIHPIHSSYFDFSNVVLPCAVSLICNSVKNYFEGQLYEN